MNPRVHRNGLPLFFAWSDLHHELLGAPPVGRRHGRVQTAPGCELTHDLRLAAHVCDKILVMYAGDVVERSDARNLLADPRHPYTRSLKRANPTISGPRMRLPTKSIVVLAGTTLSNRIAGP